MGIYRYEQTPHLACLVMLFVFVGEELKYCTVATEEGRKVWGWGASCVRA